MRILEAPIKKSDLAESSSNFIDENAIKAAVDVKKGIIAVDAPMHYECAQLLLENGSAQEDLWGINLYLDEEETDNMIEFNSMINIRPNQNNRSRSVESPALQEKIKEIVARWIV